MKKKLIFYGFFCMMTLQMLAQPDYYSPGTVRMKCGQLYLNGELFTPIVLNTHVIVKRRQSTCILSPNWRVYYTNSALGNTECNDLTSCREDILELFNTYRAAGFNTLRVGLAAGEYGGIFSYDSHKFEQDCGNSAYENLVLIDSLLTLVDEAGLKAILVTGHKQADDPDFGDAYLDYLEELSDYFQTDPRILAFDLFNEPSNFTGDSSDYTKGDVCNKVQLWVDRIRYHSRNLTTISIYSNAHEWDYNMMNVDFISFHWYGNSDPTMLADEYQKQNEDFSRYERNRVHNFSASLERMRSTIKHAANTCRRPWMIGETSFPASSDSTYDSLDVGTPTEQIDYAVSTITASRNFGAIGYSWFEAGDGVNSGLPIEDYMGIYEIDGMTPKTQQLIAVFQNAESLWNAPPGSSSDPPSYYNYWNYPNSLVHGNVKDKEGNNINGAIVTGKARRSLGLPKPKYNFTTYTDEYGDYTIPRHSAYEIVDVEVYAGGYSYDKKSVPFSPIAVNFELDYVIPVPANYHNYLPVAPAGSKSSYNTTNNMTIEDMVIGSTDFTVRSGCSINVRDAHFIRGSKARLLITGTYNPICEFEYGSNKLAPSGPPKKDEKEEEIAGPEENYLHIFPNPTSGKIVVESNEFDGNTRLEVLDYVGRQVLSDQSPKDQKFNVDLEGYPKGVYVIRLVNKDKVSTYKIVLD